MKKLIALCLCVAMLLCGAASVSAADSKVTYDGDAREFVFAPGGEYSLTDLFPNFKDVMPGDSITQKVTVKNDASKEVKVEIFMRVLGAHEDSVEFLSQLGLTVKKSADNDMAYMFDATADQTAQLTDWVSLGILYSGGEVNLDVVLDVPVTLDNEFKNYVGYLDWQFRVVEYPVEPGDPDAPVTGEKTSYGVWFALLGGCVLTAGLFLLWYKRKKDDQETI